MSLAPRADGYSILPTVAFHDLLRTMRLLGHGDVLHIHWTSPILQNAPSRAVAQKRLRRFSRALRGLEKRRASLIWTVHNRLPHEISYRDEEVELYRLLANQADRVHVMSPSTAEVLADTCTIAPEKTRTIPHPSYAGVYDTGMTRAQARAAFNLGEKKRSVLFVGQIRPYKGVSSLVRAVEIASRTRRDLVLLLAGKAKEGSEEGIDDLVPSHVTAHTHFDFVPDDEIARWYLAADITVLPYRAVLNSGSIHLAATFRVPVIIPDEPHLREQFDRQPWVAFFDPADPEESIARLLADEATFADLAPADFDDFLRDISPWRVSLQYLSLLADLTSQHRH